MSYNCLYIHPYVHVTIEKDEALFYNTLSYDSCVVNDTDVLKILNNPATPEMNVFLINRDDLSGSEVVSFIEKIRALYMGDLMIDVNPKCLPVQIPLKPKVHHNYSAESSRTELDEGYLLLDNLHQITIYTNKIEFDELRFKDAYKQFLYFKSMDGELNVELILKRLTEFRLDNLQAINIVGDSNYKEFDRLTDSLRSLQCAVNYIYNLDSITSRDLLVLDYDNSRINIQVSFPCDVSKVEWLCNKVDNYGSDKIAYSFIIESSDDLLDAQKTINGFSINQYEYKPYLSESNYEFFRDNVFVSQSDILSTEYNSRDILINQTMSLNFFGKLVIYENGDVFSNVNKNSLGNLDTQSIASLIKQEFQSGNSWLLTRDKREKCSNCIYRYICPAISNYEFFADVDTICLKYNMFSSLTHQTNFINQTF